MIQVRNPIAYWIDNVCWLLLPVWQYCVTQEFAQPMLDNGMAIELHPYDTQQDRVKLYSWAERFWRAT